MKRHEFACASSHHLWEALEEASEKPVTKIMKSWIEQPGFPLVEVKREGDKLLLAQRRFSYLPNDSKQEWLIPVAIKIFYMNGHSKTITTLLDKENTTVDIASDAAGYKVNHDQPGFYRVKYLEHGDLQELGKRVENKELSPVDRWGLQNDLYALVRGGDFAIDDYLNFLSYYSREDSFLPLTSIAGNLFHAYLVMEGAKREKVASIGEGLLKKVLSDMGYEPNRDEKQTTSILRDQIIWHAVVYGSQDVAKFTMGKFISLMSGEIVHPYIMRSVMQVGALNGGTEVFKWFVKRLGSSESEHDRINILMALGNFKEKSLIEKTQQYVLHKVPNRNKFVPIGHMAANPYAIPHMWEWHMSNLDALEQFHPMHYGRVVGAIVPVCGIGKEAQIKSFFENYMSKKKKAKDVIKLSLEKLAINSRMRNS